MNTEKKSQRIMFADFETTSINHSINHTHVAIYYITIFNSFGYSITDFIKEAWENHDVCYFHNLSFDGEFLISWLIKNKYVFDDKLKTLKSFSYLKSSIGVLYTIKVRINNKCIIYFKDSYKLIPLSIKKIGDFLKLNKKEIDYEIFNDLYNAKNKELFCNKNVLIKEYLKRDVIIIKNFLEVIDRYHHVLPNTTISSYSLKDFMYFGAYLKKFCYNINESDWYVLRLGYFGGLTNYNLNYLGKEMKGTIYHYDVNSIYPFIMKNYYLPYGKPFLKEPPDEIKKYYLKIYNIKIFKITKKDKNMINHFHYPWGGRIKYLDNHTFRDDYYVTYCEEEWNELLKTYDIEYEITMVYWFKQKKIFTDFVNKWENLKKKYEKDNPNYLFTKLVQNSLYGKLGQKSIFYREILDENYVAHIIEDKKNIYSPIYLALTITSKARCILLRIIRENFKKFIYCDTDSIVGYFKLPKEMVDDKEYGKWKLENVYSKFKVLKQKCYLAKTKEGNYKSAVSGMSKDCQKLLNFDNFYYGSIFEKIKLTFRKVEGGRLLIPCDFVIRNESKEI